MYPSKRRASLPSACRCYRRPAALEAAQDRLNEKHLFQKLGITTPEFAAVADQDSLDGAVKKIGLPAILKTLPHGLRRQGAMDFCAARKMSPELKEITRGNRGCREA